MNKYRVLLMFLIICLWLVTVCHGQERSVNNKAAEPSTVAGGDSKKESPKQTLALLYTLKAQKEKYQKQLQENINNKIGYLDNKLKKLNNFSKQGEAASKNKNSDVAKGPGVQKEPSQSGERGKAAEESKKEPSESIVGGKTADPNLWGKIISFLETVMGYWKKLSSFFSFLFK
jgi:hypothetical protein